MATGISIAGGLGRSQLSPGVAGAGSVVASMDDGESVTELRGTMVEVDDDATVAGKYDPETGIGEVGGVAKCS